MPSRPWRREPDRKATAISISSGLARFSRSARSSILARRPLVAATRREVWTSSWNNTTGPSRCEDLPDVREDRLELAVHPAFFEQPAAQPGDEGPRGPHVPHR